MDMELQELQKRDADRRKEKLIAKEPDRGTEILRLFKEDFPLMILPGIKLQGRGRVCVLLKVNLPGQLI